MTLRGARQVLRDGGEWVELAEAIGIVIASPKSSLDDCFLGLQHPGFVAEQAAMALYVRTRRPKPAKGRPIETSPSGWREWLAGRPLATLAQRKPREKTRQHRPRAARSAARRKASA